MPRIIDYPRVVEQMSADARVSLYPNSGAFGFAPGVEARAVGWVGGDDASIRPEARALARPVAPPYEVTLASLAGRAWRELLPGDVWVLPKSHWAYELQFGSHEWMPDLLRDVGVDPRALEARHDGTALAFEVGEGPAFERLVAGLLARLLGSDFMLAWPGRPALCTVHHHKQLWWTTTEEPVYEGLERIVRTTTLTSLSPPAHPPHSP
jgi:hypothetical protein